MPGLIPRDSADMRAVHYYHDAGVACAWRVGHARCDRRIGLLVVEFLCHPVQPVSHACMARWCAREEGGQEPGCFAKRMAGTKLSLKAAQFRSAAVRQEI